MTARGFSLIRTCFASRYKKFYRSLAEPCQGFSLIEILVAVGIIAILGGIAIPNLRNFSSSQEIDTTASQVVNTLRLAQSSAASRIRCPISGENSDTWIIRLTTNNYSIISRCQTSGDQIVSTYTYTPDGSGAQSLFSGSVDICPNLTTDVIFNKSAIQYSCFGTGLTSDLTQDIRLTLRNSTNTLSRVVKIERGGVIKIE